MSKKNQTVVFTNRPKIRGYYSIVGKKEGEGNFKDYFDYILKDDKFGEKTYEHTERKILEQAVFQAVQNSNLKTSDIQVMLCGDLLDQIISSAFTARHFNTVFLGVYGACSTIAESMGLGAVLIDGKHFDNIVCGTVSHFSSVERQYRFPLELGNQRPPTSQWTVTGSGAVVLSSSGENCCEIQDVTFGKVIDYGVMDVNNMGAAMAPAIAIIGLCGMILPRISNTKIYSKGGKYSINNVCEIQLGSQQNILLTFYYRIKIQII